MAVQPCNISESCFKHFSCATPETPIDGAIYAPYVEMKFGSNPDQKIVLTVGNQSAPSSNLAAITSFTTGSEVGGKGFGAEVEILDHGGAMYKEIIRNLNKNLIDRKKEALNLYIDYGWIVTYTPDSGNEVELKTLYTTVGKSIKGIFLKVDTNFSGGNVKMKLSIGAPKDEDKALDGTMGSDDSPMDLKDAIEELLTRDDVGFSEVQFKSAEIKDEYGNIIEDEGELRFRNRDGGVRGPKSSWPMDQRTATAIVRQWLTNVVSENGRGLLIIYDSDSNAIIIKEDPLDPAGEATAGCCATSIATYVVNGGGCSPVLEFNPSVEWVPGMIPGPGGMNGGPNSGKTPLLEPINDVQKTGTQSSPFMDQHLSTWRSPDDQPDEANEAFAANLLTEEQSGPGLSGGKGGWSAELKIMGDPLYGDPVQLIGRSISIVFINPFIFGKDELTKKPVWLSTSDCNSMLSNKRYNIKAVTHNISNGSYTTTLKLQLSLPNISIDWDSTLGGNGCGSLEQKFADSDSPSGPPDKAD